MTPTRFLSLFGLATVAAGTAFAIVENISQHQHATWAGEGIAAEAVCLIATE